MDTTAKAPVAQRERVRAATAAALAAYAQATPGVATDGTHDAGPAILASLGAGIVETELIERVLARWMNGIPDEVRYVGSFEGLAGFFVGASAASALHPRFGSLAVVARDSLTGWSGTGHWRARGVGWADYDLISGPAGVALALTAGGAGTEALPVARVLARLCDGAELDGLRLADDAGDERRAWNVGRINTGLAHGITGVAAALRIAADAALAAGVGVGNGSAQAGAAAHAGTAAGTGAAAPATAAADEGEFAAPLRRLCAWLQRESYVDTRGLRSWPPAGLDGRRPAPGASHRQAWCYGTPGVAWTLWDAARVLRDPELRAFAEDAMRSFCAVFDHRYHLDDGPTDAALGVCHGAAGILAVADAFARYAGLPEAAALREHLTEHLTDRLADVAELARTNMTLLTGAAGILAVLVTTCDGDRGWLTQIALR